MQPLTPLSQWMKDWVNALGEGMDNPMTITPESLATFESSLRYNMNEYICPRGVMAATPDLEY